MEYVWSWIGIHVYEIQTYTCIYNYGKLCRTLKFK